eukprot:Clim_evm17s207 gene=Clim_evmTU17s207
MADLGEEQILLRRLLTEDRHVNAAINMFMDHINGEVTAENEATKPADEVLGDIKSLLANGEWAMQRLSIGAEMRDREVDHYHTIQGELQSGIQRTKQEITELQETLSRERQLKAHREEYDALAKVIRQQASREQTNQQINEYNERIEALKRESQSMDETLEQRRDQAKLLLLAIYELQTNLKLEEGDNAITQG